MWAVSDASFFMRSLLHRWASLGVKVSSLARTHTDHAAAIHEILAGNYIEAAVSSAYLPKLHSKFLPQPSIVNAIFLFFGSAFFLYIKAQQGPGPFAPATVLACICLGRPCPFSGVAFTLLLSYRYNLNNVGFISVCLLQGLLQADLAE
jgi:hypothetical protein